MHAGYLTRTNTHASCVILNAFPPQQALHERASILRYSYIPCIVAVCERSKKTLLPFRTHVLYTPISKKLIQHPYWLNSIDFYINFPVNHTYLLIPRYRVLLEKLTGLQLVKKFLAFHGTRRFITALTSVRHLSLSWASPIQPIYPHPTSWRSILILSTHLRPGLPSGLLPSGFPSKTLYNPPLLNHTELKSVLFCEGNRIGQHIPNFYSN